MAPVLSTTCRKAKRELEIKSAVSALKAHSPSTIMDRKPPAVKGLRTPSTSKKITFVGSSGANGGKRCARQLSFSFSLDTNSLSLAGSGGGRPPYRLSSAAGGGLGFLASAACAAF